MPYERNGKTATTIYLDKPVDSAVAAAASKDRRKKAPFIALFLSKKFGPKKVKE